MKKIFKRMPKKTIAFVVVLAVVINYLGFADVSAQNKSVTLTISVPNEDPVELAVLDGRGQNANPLAYNQAGDFVAGRIGSEDPWHILDVMYANNDEISTDNISVTCSDSKHCTMTVIFDESEELKVSTAGGTTYDVLINGNLNTGNPDSWFSTDTNIELSARPEEHNFDGSVFVVWACNDGSACMYRFDNVDTGHGTVYYQASTVVDGRTGQQFNAFGGDNDVVRGYILPAVLEEWVGVHYPDKTIATVPWGEVEASLLLFGEDMNQYEIMAENAGACTRDVDRETFERCVDEYLADNNISAYDKTAIQPLPDEPQGANMYTSYGDRQFKITIYGSQYKGLAFEDFNDLHYVPIYWSDDVRVDAIDMTETTKDNPAVLEPNILESTLNLKPQTITSFNISSITPLDVPEGAVQVTKNNDGSFKLVFKSNFYDSVIFELKDSASNKYYLQIKRTTLFANIFRPDNFSGKTTFGVEVDLFYDENTSYQDYDITATYIYEDGHKKIRKLENSGVVLEGFSDYVHKTATDGGLGLSKSNFKVDENENFTDGLKEIYFNVRRVGSTDKNYSGTFAGSGKGIKVRVENGQVW